jgi:hypothetical protein
VLKNACARETLSGTAFRKKLLAWRSLQKAEQNEYQQESIAPPEGDFYSSAYRIDITAKVANIGNLQQTCIIILLDLHILPCPK